MNKDKAIQLLERLQDPEPYEPMLTKDAYDAIQMAIDALSADGDTISRKAAVEALDDAENAFGYLARDWREVLMELPPVQTEQLGTNLVEVGTDCISRQAAIDRATKEHDFFRGAVTVSDKARRDELLNVMCWLGELPPAQPEHIRGHWICDRSWSEGVGMGESYGHYWKCDKCGHLEQGDWGECGCNFCSNCGSDNREVTT